MTLSVDDNHTACYSWKAQACIQCLDGKHAYPRLGVDDTSRTAPEIYKYTEQ